MDTNLDEEYLEQLVVEVEGKVGAMPECLLKPLSKEPTLEFISSINSPFSSPRISTVVEDQCIVTKASRPKEEPEKDIDTSEEGNEEDDNLRTDSHTSGRVTWKDQYDAVEKSLQYLKDSMNELRSQDVELVRQLLSVNDSIEELKWLNEACELCEPKDKKDSINSRSLSRYDSVEQLHERWLSERRLLNTSRTSLNNSITNLSSSLGRLNQNNNSNSSAWKEHRDEIAHAFGPDTSPIAGVDFEPYHQRSMSTSCTDKTEHIQTLPRLLQNRPASSIGLVRMDRAPSTSTPKSEPSKTEPRKTEPSKTEPSKTEPTKTEPCEAEPPNTKPNKLEESNASTVDMDISQISRVRVGSYGSQVRWYYRETSEELYF